MGRQAGGLVGRLAGGPVGRWAGGLVGRWAGGPVGRWAGGPVGRWLWWCPSSREHTGLVDGLVHPRAVLIRREVDTKTKPQERSLRLECVTRAATGRTRPEGATGLKSGGGAKPTATDRPRTNEGFSPALLAACGLEARVRGRRRSRGAPRSRRTPCHAGHLQRLLARGLSRGVGLLTRASPCGGIFATTRLKGEVCLNRAHQEAGSQERSV